MSARLLRPASFLVLLTPLYVKAFGYEKGWQIWNWSSWEPGPWMPRRSESPHLDVPVESFTIVIAASDGGLSIETTRQDKDSPVFHEILHVKLDGSETTSDGNAGCSREGPCALRMARALVVETARGGTGDGDHA